MAVNAMGILMNLTTCATTIVPIVSCRDNTKQIYNVLVVVLYYCNQIAA